ncbi:MAG: GNAT family N-acetyltransferase [Candidatus Eremiobacteraeota bacterium]|nr:GNAT family N-acetyltransferase [Candidatus Eremiobacteraeota bacterium]
METPTLRTERLDLFPIRGVHANEAWRLVDDERMWTYFPALRPRSIDDLRRLYEKWERGSPDSDEIWLNWLCRDRVGAALVGAMQATIREPQLAFIAYAIYPAYQRKGYACEAVQEVINHLRSAYGVTRVCAEIHSLNVPSFRLMESLGFSRVGVQQPEESGQKAQAEYLYELRF